jgi:DNA-binding GntR family transcriptional regulator
LVLECAIPKQYVLPFQGGIIDYDIQNAVAQEESIKLSGLTKIKLASINNECYVQIKNAILTEVFQWGDKLDVGKLAENFGISKFPVIKALDKLAIEHLVTILPNKGTFVTVPTVQDVIEVSEIRIMLEDLAFKLACNKNLITLVKMLEKNEKDNEKNFESFCLGRKFEEYQKYDREYHECLIICSDNHRLMNYWEVIRSQVELFRKKDFLAPNIIAAINCHREILAFLKQNEIAKAKEQLRKHLEQVQSNILNSLEG